MNAPATWQTESPACRILQKKTDASESPAAQMRPARGPASAPPNLPSAGDSNRHPRPESAPSRPMIDKASPPNHHPVDGPAAQAEIPTAIRAYRAVTHAETASTQPWHTQTNKHRGQNRAASV